MSKITVLNEKAICLDIPENALEISVVPMTSAGTHSGLGLRIRVKSHHSINYKSLPPGSWSILGRPEELTSNQWYGIVPGDYPKKKGIELLKSKSLEGASIIILIKQ